MVVIVFFRCSFFEHFQFGISIRVLSGLCSLSIFFLLFFSIRHRVLTPVVNSSYWQTLIVSLRKIVPSKILRCLLPGSGKTKSWLMLLRALRAKSVIHVSVGFDSSPPKPLSRSLLQCLGCVSTFSGLFVLSDSIVVSFGYAGSFVFTYSRT